MHLDSKKLAAIQNWLHPGFIAGPVSEKRISAAETELSLLFPPSYRQFLEQFGGGIVNGYEIYGRPPPLSGDQTPLWSDVVEATIRTRKVSRGNIPLDYISLSSDGGDYHYYFDTSQKGKDGECIVVVLGPGADGYAIAKNFFEFLGRIANDETLIK